MNRSDFGIIQRVNSMSYSMLNPVEKSLFIKKVLERGDFFQDAQVLPVNAEFDYHGWLSNFSNVDEKYIAAKMLSNFLYYPRRMVDRMLYDAIGCAAEAVQDKRGKFADDFHEKDVIYSYIPGEIPNPTDSGNMFLRKVREVLHIVDQERLRDFAGLEDLLLREGIKRQFNIIFCDDFVGSGCQCLHALFDRNAKLNMSLYEYARRYGHVLAYAPLIANVRGAVRITRQMPDLIFTPIHVLGREYNLFDPLCICWEGDFELFKFGVDMVLRISKELGIPDDCRKTVSCRGFGNQGLFIGFEHGIPDADPALFFFSDKGWNPLMRRVYERD